MPHLPSQYCKYAFCSQMKRARGFSFPHFSGALAGSCPTSGGEADGASPARANSCDDSLSDRAGVFDLFTAPSFAGVYAADEGLESRLALVNVVLALVPDFTVEDAMAGTSDADVFVTLSSDVDVGCSRIVPIDAASPRGSSANGVEERLATSAADACRRSGSGMPT